MAHRKEYITDGDEWRAHALCAGLDPNIFFPNSEAEQAEVAAKFCGGCVVRQECLNDAIFTRQEHGVLGGATEAERRVMLGRKKRSTKQA